MIARSTTCGVIDDAAISWIHGERDAASARLGQELFLDFARLLPFAGPRPCGSARAFERYLIRRGCDFQTASIEAVLRAMLSFYVEQPFRGLARDDPDMLLFEYGCYDWGGGERFQLGLVRQFVAADRESTISQLCVTFFFAPDAELRALGASEAWCGSHREASAFGRRVLGDAAIAAVRTRTPVERAIVWTPT